MSSARRITSPPSQLSCILILFSFIETAEILSVQVFLLNCFKHFSPPHWRYKPWPTHPHGIGRPHNISWKLLITQFFLHLPVISSLSGRDIYSPQDPSSNTLKLHYDDSLVGRDNMSFGGQVSRFSKDLVPLASVFFKPILTSLWRKIQVISKRQCHTKQHNVKEIHNLNNHWLHMLYLHSVSLTVGLFRARWNFITVWKI